MCHHRIARRLGSALAAVAMAFVGCDAEPEMNLREATRSVGPTASAPAPATASAPAPAAASVGSAADEPKSSATAGRKIIYNAHVDLVTEDLALLEANLTKQVLAQRAYVADSERTGSAGSSRRGTWKVRVPVDGYDAFVKGVSSLGELVSLKADSQDVSEEYVDLDARQVAKKVEEARLLKHLTESTGKLDEILTVERELSRVRGEVERMQGRLRALANLASLATVTINASEIKGYVPPQAPTLGIRVGRTFAASVDSLRQFGEAILISCVAILPWLPLVAIGLGIVVWLSRQAARASTARLIDPVDSPRERI